ncbi:hypothetical protein ACSBR1_028467 [Camellia fascicularis]
MIRFRCILAVIGEGSSSRSKHRVLMSFGDGSQGVLGVPFSAIGMGGDAYEPTVVPILSPDVSSICAGHYHSLAVTSLEELWAWGRNIEAQLCPHEDRDVVVCHSSKTPENVAPMMRKPNHKPPRNDQNFSKYGQGSGSNLVVVILSGCERESWNEPKRVEGLDQVKVQAAFASGVISAAIGDDGSLWVWGKSKRGQLGLGKGITESVSPSRVEALAGEEIVKVSLGWGHALAQTKDGKLFGWGYSADARLGQMRKPLESSHLDSSSDIPKATELSSSVLEAAEKLV